MKILFLSHELPPIGGGGGLWTQNVSRLLVRKGHHVQVITSHIKGLPKKETLDGVVIYRLPTCRKKYYRASFISMAMYIVRTFWRGLRLIHQWHPDVIQVVFAVPAGVAGYLLSKVTGTPYVISARLGDVPGDVPEKTRKWFRWIFPFTVPVWRNASKVTAVSNFTGSLVRQSYHLDPIVIPNGYDPELIPPQEIHLNQPPVVIFAGRFVPQKNLLEFVEIMASLKDLPWKCKLVGDGPLRPLIEESIVKHKLSDRFEITGWVNPEEMIVHLRSSDLLFMPSLSEGLSNVGVCAVAVGLTIIAYDVGGFDELVNNNINGLKIEPGKIQEMSEGLRSFLVNPEKMLRARNASLTHAKRFDLNRIVDAYEQIYHGVLK